jgi:hypothetical protein
LETATKPGMDFAVGHHENEEDSKGTASGQIPFLHGGFLAVKSTPLINYALQNL